MSDSDGFERHRIVVPGELIVEGSKYRAGFGTYKEDDKLFASVIGFSEIRGNNNVYVVPFSGPYIPKVGDVIIGKIINTSIVSWKVDIDSPYTASLHVSNVIDRTFNPLKDNIRNYFDVGHIIVGEIIAFNRTRDPVISIRGKGYGKLRGGKIIKIASAKIPRLIGRKGSMINLIKEATKSQIVVGQNGLVWLNTKNLEDEKLLIKIIRKIEQEAHTSGLTDRVKLLIENEKKERGN
ncbi:MAG: exosome complex RNA-binding protein Rrp4 [Candidatus Hodarchaeota archaeon]